VKKRSYSIEPISPFRQLVIDGMQLAARRHSIHGLVEIDVTRARERIRKITASTGESLSFTGFIVYCCARAIEEDTHVHAYRDWRNRLVLFDDVDVSLPVERVGEGQPVVLQTVIRAANRKSVWQIHREIRELQTKTLDDTQWGRWLRWYVRVPGCVRRLLFRMVERAPTVLKRFNGTVLVTSVGMFGSVSGWGIPLPGHTLCVTVGGVGSKPVLHDGTLQSREHLRLTVTFDHDIVDGGPAARFIQRLAELVESGAGIPDAE
jgi:pyruvate/2-oxoglutarate dehydrogenase complex dihydrolipoamide acyltransferase (E2) component